jgi:uncharacterized membrane protein
MTTNAPPVRLLSLLHRHGLGPALLSSAAAVGMLAYRLDTTRHSLYLWLVWNLFLAWVPYGLALLASVLMARGRARWWNLAPLAVAWLLVFPNAPYLLTDLIHLRPRPAVPLWFDAALLALFAAAGWLLGLLSLEVWKHWLQARLGRVGAWAFVLAVSVLSGYGIYLGRVERWNSWDVLTEPRSLCVAVLAHLRAPEAHPHLLGLTALFALLVSLSYAGFEALYPRATRGRTR